MGNLKTEIRREILAIAETDYKQFTAKLIPNIDSDKILGIRMPALRKIAKRIATQSDWKTYLSDNEDLYFEETMLRGLIINYAKIDIEYRLELTRNFVPRIDNWAVCDCFCYQVKEHEKPLLWVFIQPFLHSEKPYDIRFATIMILGNFVSKQYAETVFELFENIKNENYYVKMGIAWTLSMFYVKLPDLTFKTLINNRLDNFTHNKTLQKIIESRQVSPETKEMMRELKRK